MRVYLLASPALLSRTVEPAAEVPVDRDNAIQSCLAARVYFRKTQNLLSEEWNIGKSA